MTDSWTAMLSDYLDGELGPEERSALDEHLDECDECRSVLDQLRSVVAWAGSYPGREPRRDVWSEIKGALGGVTRLSPDRERRRWLKPSLPQALAAGVAMLLVGGGAWSLARLTAPDRAVAVIDLPAQVGGPPVATAVFAAQKYGPAIADLERMLLGDRGALDSSTVRVLREKLVIIDRAMAEAREALARDPSSDYLADHYTGMMKRKLAVLREAARSARAL